MRFESAVQELDTILNTAIQGQMMSDVPLGTFCSGGIDSSLVTAIAASAGGRSINTFSVGFDEAAFDETSYARMVARRYSTNHHELKLDASQYSELLPDMVWQNDLPLNFANSVQIFAISELAKQHVTVVLTGEGADELFGGYPRYYIPRLLAPLDRLPANLAKALRFLTRFSDDHRIHKLRNYAAQSPRDRLLYNAVASDHREIPARYAGQWPEHFAFREEVLREGEASGVDAVTNLGILDQRTYLVSILNRQDKMSMAAGLEARVPFLDNSLIEFSSRVPLSFKQTARHRKRVLKAVARRYLPDAVVDRRKSGFGVPLGTWMKVDGPLAERVRSLPENSLLTEFFPAESLRSVIGEHDKGTDQSDFLWSCINFAIWRERFAV
jgi:asparagine synthase (glutamine-hydrolysing)